MKLFKRARSRKAEPSVMTVPAKVIPDPEDPDKIWVEYPDGLRLIFRDGKYVGWYATLMGAEG